MWRTARRGSSLQWWVEDAAKRARSLEHQLRLSKVYVGNGVRCEVKRLGQMIGEGNCGGKLQSWVEGAAKQRGQFK